LVPVLLPLALVLAVTVSCTTVKSGASGADGDRKIKDTIEDIRKKEAKARTERRGRREQEQAEEEEWWEQDPGEDSGDYDRYDEDENEGEGFVWLDYAVAVRFADYP
jgi:hypothetical protein